MSATLFNLTPIESAQAPNRESLHPPEGRETRYRFGDIDDLLGRTAHNCRDHREVLVNLPPRRTGQSLQVYFW
jgi:hypothetical protein